MESSPNRRLVLMFKEEHVSDTDLLDFDTADMPEAQGLTPEQVKAEAAKIVDGIYFGLDEEIYHAVERLSNSGIQKLVVSAGTFWVDSWLNPSPPRLTDEQAKRREMIRVLGRAYHCARLEPDQFEKRYCRAIDKTDYDLTSDSAIKAQLKALEQKQTVGDESILDRARRLVEAGFEGTIYHIALDAWEKGRNGRIPIAGVLFDDILRDQERLLANGPIVELFGDGQPEVSIFWTDDEHGIQMKCRIDWLTAMRALDFKTFDNSRGKVLDQAIADAVRYNRYYTQPAVYRDAMQAVRMQSLEIQGEATDDQRKLVARIRIAPQPPQFWFVFQEKNGVPNLLARQFMFFSIDAWRDTEVEALVEEERQAEVKEALGKQTQIYQLALADIRNAKRQFLLYSQVYPAGAPWAPTQPLGTLDDLDFSQGWLEGKWR